MANKDIDAVAIKIVALDNHVAEIDGDAQFDAVVRRDTSVSLRHRLLNVDCAAHRIMLSPVVLTVRPWCSAMFGSRSSRRNAFRRSTPPHRRRGSRRDGG
jgi:hypothetical protein